MHVEAEANLPSNRLAVSPAPLFFPVGSFETVSPYVARTSLKFTIPLSLLSECWDYCQVPSYLDGTSLLELSMMM